MHSVPGKPFDLICAAAPHSPQGRHLIEDGICGFLTRALLPLLGAVQRQCGQNGAKGELQEAPVSLQKAPENGPEIIETGSSGNE